MRVRGVQEREGESFGDIETSTFRIAHEGDSDIGGQPSGLCDVGCRRKVAVDGRAGDSVQGLALLRAVIEADDRNINVRSINDPISIAYGEEDVTRGFNAVQ